MKSASAFEPVVIRAIEGSSSDPKLRHFLHHLLPVRRTEQSFPVPGNDLQVHKGHDRLRQLLQMKSVKGHETHFDSVSWSPNLI